jgi:hypothetical protein
MSALPEEKICFVIAPIGEVGSDIRKRSDLVFKHIIEPIVRAQGYKAIRADHISTPGVITSQIIDQVLNAHLVIADLTGQNPNVFYELALRHMVKKPVVQMTKEGESLPFDVSGQRTIHFDYQDLDSVEAAKAELERQVKAVEKDPTQVDSPVSMAINLGALEQRNKPEDTALLQVISLLQEIKAEQREIRSQMPTTLGESVSINALNRRLRDAGVHGFGFTSAPLTLKENRHSTQDDDIGEGSAAEEGLGLGRSLTPGKDPLPKPKK